MSGEKERVNDRKMKEENEIICGKIKGRRNFDQNRKVKRINFEPKSNRK